MSKRHLRAGVTLLEMLCALLLMAFVANALASSFGFYGGLLVRMEGFGREVETALARRTLRNWITSMPLRDDDPDRGPALTGSSRAFEARTWLETAEFWPGAPVEVSVELDTSGAVTVQATGLAEVTRAQIDRQMVLFVGIDDVSITYFGRSGEAPVFVWSDAWQARDRLPELVKIETISDGQWNIPILLKPGDRERQRFKSLSSLLPPAWPSRPSE